MRVLSLVLASAAIVAGCAPKHPVVGLEREARRHERKFEREEAAATRDASYFVPLADARSTAATLLAPAEIPEVEELRLASDWTYSGEVGVDQTSELFRQVRQRTVVTLSPIGAEVDLSGATVRERRELRPGRTAGGWSSESSPLDVSPVRAHLQRLEGAHLARVKSGASPGALLDDFERVLPAGFVVTARDGSTLSAERVTRTRKDRERHGWWAAWEARLTLVARVSEAGDVSTSSTLEHRFSTESEAGTWRMAETQNPAPATDWAARALRLAIPAGHARYGEPLAQPLEPRRIPLSAPPEPPRLRTMDEIAVAVRQRAFEQQRGDFQVCVDHILVNPTDQSGYDWDLPGVSDALSVTEVMADGVEGAMGEVNRVADAAPVLGAAVDTGVAFLTSDMIDRHQAEYIAHVTRRVSGWAKGNPIFRPDLAGSVVIGAQAHPLSETPDSFRAAPDLCGAARFEPGRAVVALELWDVDLDDSDPVGRCSITPDDILRRGIRGVPCGFARIYLSAEYRFSYPQIALVGLPPAE